MSADAPAEMPRRPAWQRPFAWASLAVFALLFTGGAYHWTTIGRAPAGIDLEYNWWFDALEREGRHEERLAQAELSLVIDHGFEPIAHARIGDSLAQAGRFEEAVGAYRDALAIDPTNTGVLNHLAIALAERGDLDRAIAALEHALRIDPGFAAARNNHAALVAHREARRRGEAAR